MYSVTKRVSMVKQPRGGYISPKQFQVIEKNDNMELHENENIHATLIGLAVDYLTRLMMKTPKEMAFHISVKGAERIGDEKNAEKLLARIKGLDNDSILCACKIVGYDICARAGNMGIARYKPVNEIEPNEETIENIRLMVQRSLDFWSEYGPILKDGFTFFGGYTNVVSSGDGDYLSYDTLWDFKVSKAEPQKTHTLQLLMYWIMGCHSIHNEFDTIKKLGIFNPRKNKIYLLKISDIKKEIIQEVEKEVIGYDI